jgi:hypothetical protein
MLYIVLRLIVDVEWLADTMTRLGQGICILLCSAAISIAAVAAALASGPHHCALVFPKIIGCALGNYEALTSGLIAASATLFAGWLAWSGVQAQIETEEKRASADRAEVEALLREDLDRFADGLGSIWKLLDGLDLEATKIDQDKIDAVSYGIDAISKANWLSTSRRMVTILGMGSSATI